VVSSTFLSGSSVDYKLAQSFESDSLTEFIFLRGMECYLLRVSLGKSISFHFIAWTLKALVCIYHTGWCFVQLLHRIYPQRIQTKPLSLRKIMNHWRDKVSLNIVSEISCPMYFLSPARYLQGKPKNSASSFCDYPPGMIRPKVTNSEECSGKPRSRNIHHGITKSLYNKEDINLTA
jgi:hypothetical protein